MSIGLAVAIETEFHGKRFYLGDNLHLVDSAVAFNAADTTIDVSTVVEINEVGKLVNSLPLNGVIRLQRLANRLEFFTRDVDD